MSSIKSIALAKITGGGGGGDTEIQALNVTQNGTYNPGSGKAYKPVTVNIQPNLQTKTTTVNGDVEPDTGYDGLSKVTVNVPSSSPNLQSKTVTQNGTVTADAGYDGLSSVVVNVSGGGGNVIISDQAPTADVGEVGQYYIWETEDTNIVYGIRIQVAARGTNYGFNYWGARDIDFVFTDGTSEYHLREFNNAACAYAIGESGTFNAENGTIDGATNQYREHNGLPGYYKISADIPTGMALSKVRICVRNDTWGDFWRTFTIGQWSSDKTFANTLIAEENLVLSDWDTSSQGAYTEFVLDNPVSPTRINTSKLYIKTADGWVLL